MWSQAKPLGCIKTIEPRVGFHVNSTFGVVEKPARSTVVQQWQGKMSTPDTKRQ